MEKQPQSNQESTTSTSNSFGGQGLAGTSDDDSFTAAVKRNLEKNREAQASSNKWFALAAGDTALLEFTGNFGPVKKDFDKDGIAERVLYEYEVIDKRYPEALVQLWDLSKSWALDLDPLLEAGHRLIEAYRRGSKKNDTKYTFTPKDSPVSAS